MKIYLDNAATTPLLPEVVEVMTAIMQNDFGNPSSIHSHGRKAKTIIENARRTMAQTINASLSEIFFTSSATEANNMILKMAVQSKVIKRIISSPTEHHCVLHTLDYMAEQNLCEVVYLAVNTEGFIDMEELEMLLSEKNTPTLVSIMHANNEIGTLQDIENIALICQKYDALFHSDTVQTIGKIPIDIQKIPLHFLSASAHKLHGPKGVGFVYINSHHLLPPFIHGGSQERNMRAGTENVIGIGGFAKAMEMAQNEMQHRTIILKNLKNTFKNLITHTINDITFLGSTSENQASHHIVNLSMPPTPKSELLVMNLDIAGISVSSGSACTAGIEQESHVLKAIGHPSDRPSVRISFSHLNTIDEIEFTVKKLAEMI